MIIADTGFFLALANRRDAHHAVAVGAYEKLSEPLVTTWPVIAETSHLLLHRLGLGAQRAFLHSWKQGAFRLFAITDDSAGRICQLAEKYRDLPMDLADASLVLLAEHLNDGRILSTDQRDFKVYRWKNHHPFKNLLLSK
jgi:predicted nucleic acid-binding protein